MALSGSLTTNAYGGVRSLTLSWSATQSIANNTSTITWTLSGSGSTANYNPYYLSGPFRVTIDGNQVHYSTSRIQLRSGTVVASGSNTIYHNDDGTKSVSITIEGAIYTTSINCTATQTFQLDTIPRQATLLDAPNFYDDENPTISFSNPAGAAVSVEVYLEKSGSPGNIPVSGRTITTSPYTIQITSAERTALQKLDTTSNTAQVRFVLKSTIGSSIYYSYLDRTMTIRNPAPVLNPTAVDVGSVSVPLTGDGNNKVIRYSSAERCLFNASAVKGASIVSRKLVNGSKVFYEDTVIEPVDGGDFVFSVTDSRGNTTTKTLSKTVVPYVKLTCNIGQGVPNAAGTYDFQVSGDYFNGSFGAASNTLSVQYQYREAGGTWTSWKSMTASPGSGNYTATAKITGLNYQKAYEFQAKAADKLYEAQSGVKVVKSAPVFDWGEDDFSINVPLSVQGKSLLDWIYPVGSIYISTNAANPGTLFGGTWVAYAQGRFLLGAGGDYTAGNTGGEAAHTLTVNEIPYHNHPIFFPNSTGEDASNFAPIGFPSSSGVQNTWWAPMCYTENVGGGQAHNNMPPYIACYVWRRTA